MTREHQVMLIATALLASWPQSAVAATVIVTTAAPNNFSPGSSTLNFADIANANQLVSISGGSVTNGEGGTFSVDLHYSGGSSSQIFSTSLQNNVAFNLTSIPTESFGAGTINGLTFNLPLFSRSEMNEPNARSAVAMNASYSNRRRSIWSCWLES